MGRGELCSFSTFLFGTLWVCRLPAVEQSKKLVLYLRAQVLWRKAPAQADHGPHLVDVLGAMRASNRRRSRADRESSR
jgi:hypothetical protein